MTSSIFYGNPEYTPVAIFYVIISLVILLAGVFLTIISKPLEKKAFFLTASILFFLVVTVHKTITALTHIHITMYGRPQITHKGQVARILQEHYHLVFYLEGNNTKFTYGSMQDQDICYEKGWGKDVKVGNVLEVSQIKLYWHHTCITNLVRYYRQ